jgi:alginate O-acetyltransferase complex protein AlgJ
LHWLTLVDVDWLRITPSPKVILGKRGWLFYAEKAPGLDYQSKRPFTAEQLDHWRRMLEARRDWLARRHIRFLFVIAPDKQSIYPEVLPRTVRQEQAADTRLDQLMDHLRANSDVTVVDLRECLRQVKNQERVYHVTDSHWNDRGAYAAYRVLAETLRQWFPECRPRARAEFREVLRRGGGSDCAVVLGLADRISEEYLDLAARFPERAHLADPDVALPISPIEPRFSMEQADPALPRAVMFRDSFGAQLVPFLSEHFRRIVYITEPAPMFDTNVIERERPDIVIQEMVERKLEYPDMVDSKDLPPLPGTEEKHALCRTGDEWLRFLNRGQ